MAGKKRRRQVVAATDVAKLTSDTAAAPALSAEEPKKLLEAPPIPLSAAEEPCCKHKISQISQNQDRAKVLATALLVLLAIAAGIYLFVPGPWSNGAADKLVLGAEINGVTFADILSKSDTVYIVIDLRNVGNANISRNVMQCGVDFAGSRGLVGKNLIIYSLDESGCLGLDGTSTVSSCLKKAGSGIVLHIKEGNETRFYTNMMVVGIGENYTENGCNINVKNK